MNGDFVSHAKAFSAAATRNLPKGLHAQPQASLYGQSPSTSCVTATTFDAFLATKSACALSLAKDDDLE